MSAAPIIVAPLAVEDNKFVIATCNLNNWALDFDGNLERIAASIRVAKLKGYLHDTFSYRTCVFLLLHFFLNNF